MWFGLAEEDSCHNTRKALSRYLARGECSIHAVIIIIIIINIIIIIIYISTRKSALLVSFLKMATRTKPLGAKYQDQAGGPGVQVVCYDLATLSFQPQP